MASDSYARQKTWEAVGCLVSPASMADRLEYAAMVLLPLRAHAKGSDQALFDRINALTARLTKNNTVKLDEGCRALDELEARSCADEFLDLMLTAFGGLSGSTT